MLTASGAGLVSFLNGLDPLWAQTQTVPPDDVQASAATANGIGLEWPAISYTADSGHYEISYATAPGGPYTVHGVTASKAVTHYWVDGLTPGHALLLRRALRHARPWRTAERPEQRLRPRDGLRHPGRRRPVLRRHR